jgi:glycosyltransferase involved in cell wall biosynthesis
LIHDVKDSETQSELDELISKYAEVKIRMEIGKWGNPGDARNVGISQSSGEWIIFWDSDDVGNAGEVIQAIKDAKQSDEIIIGQSETRDHVSGDIINASSSTDSLTKLALNPLRMAEDQIFLSSLNFNEHNTKFLKNVFYIYYKNVQNQLTSQPNSVAELFYAIHESRKILIRTEQYMRKFVAVLLLRQRVSYLKHLHATSKALIPLNLVKTFGQVIREPKILTLEAVFIFSKHLFQNFFSNSKNPNYVVLTGGLGNQIFQLAGALGLTRAEVVLMDCAGNPRSRQGSADLFAFNLPSRVKVHSCGKHCNLLNRTFNLHLSLGLRNRGLLSWRVNRTILHIFANTLFSLHLRKFVKIVVAKGVGFDSSLVVSGNNVIIGYLQSYKWCESDFASRELREIKLLGDEQNLELTPRPNRDSLILVVHVRLGDYRLEKDFGVLDKCYYDRAFEFVSSKMKFDQVWLFSDEPDFALSMIPAEHLAKTLVVRDFGLPPAQTLEAMRQGSAYIIGNSSFSWWAAMLSRTVNPTVVAPKVWFSGAPEPLDLTPPPWHRI